MKTTRRMALLTLVGALGLTGCGGDDDDSTAASDKTTTTAAQAGGGDLATYCEKSVEIEVASNRDPDVDFESATPEEIVAATKEFAASLQPLADEVQAAAPDEAKVAVNVQVAALAEVAETGDFEAFETPEVDQARAADHAFALEQCEWQQVDVKAINYAFEGIPAELEAGPTSFEFSNEGTELHELILIRKNDDTTESFDELLAMSEDEATAKTTVAGATFSPPGEEGVYTVTDLDAGEYIALCFIPVGSVDEETEAEGPPHFTQGMKHEFSVA